MSFSRARDEEAVEYDVSKDPMYEFFDSIIKTSVLEILIKLIIFKDYSVDFVQNSTSSSNARRKRRRRGGAAAGSDPLREHHQTVHSISAAHQEHHQIPSGHENAGPDSKVHDSHSPIIKKISTF